VQNQHTLGPSKRRLAAYLGVRCKKDKMELSEILTTKWIIIFISECITVYLWTHIYKSTDPTWYKILLALIIIIPVVGIFIYFFAQGMPSKSPQHLRATMNHYGNGGRFIGGGSKRFNYDPVEQANEKTPNKKVKRDK